MTPNTCYKFPEGSAKLTVIAEDKVLPDHLPCPSANARGFLTEGIKDYKERSRAMVTPLKEHLTTIMLTSCNNYNGAPPNK